MTTREPRTRETDGVDYRFVDRERFEAFVAAGEMLEHAVVHDECYGTPASNLGDARRAGKHLLLDIDVQGARQVRDLVNDVLSIIVLPPSVDEMFRRLSGRGSETPAQLARRAVSAVSELETVTEFGYVIVNADLDRSVEAVLAIIDAEERAVFRVGERAGEFAERLKDEIERKML
jgi:guanylate kinase